MSCEPVPIEAIRYEREQLAKWIDKNERAISITRSVLHSMVQQLKVVNKELEQLEEAQKKVAEELRK